MNLEQTPESPGIRICRDSDESLMQRFAVGSQEAFEQIFERYSSHLINFAYRFLNSQEESEDVAQEVFLRIYRAKERYDPKRSFRPYLFSIASRIVSNRIRYKKRHPQEPLEMSEEPGKETPQTKPIPDSQILPPDKQMERRQVMEAVRKALDNLPENQKTVVILARYEEMSYEEIAQVMGVSVSSVKSLLFRARESLKVSLSPEL